MKKDCIEFKMDKDCLALCMILARLQLLKEKLAPGTFQMYKGDIEITVQEDKPITVWDSRAVVMFKGPHQ